MEILICLALVIPVVLGVRAARSGENSGAGCCTVSDPRKDLRMRSAFQADAPGD